MSKMVNGIWRELTAGYGDPAPGLACPKAMVMCELFSSGSKIVSKIVDMKKSVSENFQDH